MARQVTPKSPYFCSKGGRTIEGAKAAVAHTAAMAAEYRVTDAMPARPG